MFTESVWLIVLVAWGCRVAYLDLRTFRIANRDLGFGVLIIWPGMLIFNQEFLGLKGVVTAITCSILIGLSGLVGIGGGILLTPLMILCRWATPREAAAVSAPFILLNSLAGLGGLLSIGLVVEPWLWWASAGAIVGGLIGSRWSIRSGSQLWLRRALGIVLLVAAFKFVITA